MLYSHAPMSSSIVRALVTPAVHAVRARYCSASRAPRATTRASSSSAAAGGGAAAHRFSASYTKKLMKLPGAMESTRALMPAAKALAPSAANMARATPSALRAGGQAHA